MIKKHKILLTLLIVTMIFTLVACGGQGGGQGLDPSYEGMVIQIEGLNISGEEDVIEEVTIGELRELPQYELEASYKRTTGLVEEYHMEGPYLRDIIEYLGGDLSDYAGMGVVGSDGYYCLLSKEVIDATPDLMLALAIDGEKILDEERAPAQLAVAGEFGPYWVKMVEKIILYDTIPEKDISSVWAFSPLTEGITPFEYEYYGSKDKAIEVGQILSRFDFVDSKAFFTIKSADGFKKNEAMSVVNSHYYIKIEGEDAPTNISQFVKLGMNVHNISWFSTSHDAAIFPEKLAEYLEMVEMEGERGMLLSEVLYETEVEKIKDLEFHVLGTKGEKVTLPGEDLFKGILVPKSDGKASVVWDKSTGYENIENLFRIRRADDGSAVDDEGLEEDDESEEAANDQAILPGSITKRPDSILTITGDGVAQTKYYSLQDFKDLAKGGKGKNGYLEQVFTTVNSWPTKKFMVAKGVDLNILLKGAGIKNEAATIHFTAADGYRAAITKSQLFGNRYSYPGIMSGKTDGAKQVYPMLAFASETGTQDFSQAVESGLRLIFGQQGLDDENATPSVKDVVEIRVSTKSEGRWKPPTISLLDGHIVLDHETIDKVHLHYTLDGSDPTFHSPVYNPSATYFQPELNKPVPVSGSGTFKVKAIGYGKADSEVKSFDY